MWQNTIIMVAFYNMLPRPEGRFFYSSADEFPVMIIAEDIWGRWLGLCRCAVIDINRAYFSGMLNTFFKHLKFICNHSNFIRSSKMAMAVLHYNGDSLNWAMAVTAYHLGNLCHFLCWSLGDNVQRPPPLWHYLITQYVVHVIQVEAVMPSQGKERNSS